MFYFIIVPLAMYVTAVGVYLKCFVKVIAYCMYMALLLILGSLTVQVYHHYTS